MATEKRVHIDELEAPDGTTHLLNGEPFTGIAYDLNRSGRLEEELSFRDGIQTGPMRSYDNSGRLVDEEYQMGGVAHGPRRVWHSNGRLAEEETYEFGVLLSGQYWDEDGRQVRSFALDPADPAWDTVRRYREVMGQKSPMESDGSETP